MMPIDFVERDTNLNRVSEIIFILILSPQIWQINLTKLLLSGELLCIAQDCSPSAGPISWCLHHAPWLKYGVIMDSNVLGMIPLQWTDQLFNFYKAMNYTCFLILPTADKDRYGFLWSLMSQMWINVSILQDAMMSGSLGCQFRSLTTRVWAFKPCVVCNSLPPGPLRLNISIRVLLYDKRNIVAFVQCAFI